MGGRRSSFLYLHGLSLAPLGQPFSPKSISLKVFLWTKELITTVLRSGNSYREILPGFKTWQCAPIRRPKIKGREPPQQGQPKVGANGALDRESGSRWRSGTRSGDSRAESWRSHEATRSGRRGRPMSRGRNTRSLQNIASVSIAIHLRRGQRSILEEPQPIHHRRLGEGKLGRAEGSPLLTWLASGG